MSPATIPTGLPAALVVVDADVFAAIATVESAAAAVRSVHDVSTYEAADAVAASIVSILKQVERARTTAKAPVIELGRQIDAAAGEVVAGLTAEKARLGRLIVTFQEAENRRREEERRRIQEENRRREEEARRLAEEARAKAEAEAAEARAAAEAAKASAPADDLGWGDLAEPEPAPEPPPAVVHVPELLPQLEVAPLKSAAVVRKTVREVVIVDPNAIPREVQGVALWAIDEKAVKKLALAGIQIPGVEVRSIDAIAAKGR